MNDANVVNSEVGIDTSKGDAVCIIYKRPEI